ncbi:hypothetical protein QZH41_014519 [Actinostola sp. cb2023]|nr:hypothetical protein QZH41_014519 [Actinostola sp. cb2023]
MSISMSISMSIYLYNLFVFRSQAQQPTHPSRTTINSACAPPALEKLRAMKHIVMIDLDNWRKILESDLTFSPSTFVWCFHGGTTSWNPPPSSVLLRHLQDMDCFHLHPKCGTSKDAADFALCVQAGKLDVLLPKEIPFTVLSGDKGFHELRHQLLLSKREVHIVNPHHKTTDTVLSILNSIADR